VPASDPSEGKGSAPKEMAVLLIDCPLLVVVALFTESKGMPFIRAEFVGGEEACEIVDFVDFKLAWDLRFDDVVDEEEAVEMSPPSLGLIKGKGISLSVLWSLTGGFVLVDFLEAIGLDVVVGVVEVAAVVVVVTEEETAAELEDRVGILIGELLSGCMGCCC